MTRVSDTESGRAVPGLNTSSSWPGTPSLGWGCCPGATSLEPSASPCQGPEQGSDTQPPLGWSALHLGRAVRNGEGLGAGPPHEASSLWPTWLQIPDAGPLRVPGRAARWSWQHLPSRACLKGPCGRCPPGARLGGVVRWPYWGGCTG